MLLPFAAMSGWYVAKRSDKKIEPNKLDLSKTYVQGVNYILNEQPDKAIDLFINMLDVDNDTVETHLALGGLFRRKGEVDRSIRIHQNLIARPQLFHSQRVDALMALGNDYLCAGVYDRAERIFKEVVELGGHSEQESLNYLFSIYQQQKKWRQALKCLKKLQSLTGKGRSIQVAHCYCELVEENCAQGKFNKASQYLKMAQSAEKNLVRASLLQGKLEFLQKNYKQAIKAYKKVRWQDPAFLSEIVVPLQKCYEALGMLETFHLYMSELLEEHPLMSIVFCVAKQVKADHGDTAAIDFVTDKLNQHPSLKGLNKLIEWHLDVAYGKVKDQLSMLHNITEKLLKDKPIYRCESCGFSGSHLHWNCPSCKRWNTIKPICGLEGE